MRVLFNAYGQGYGGNLYYSFYLAKSLYKILGDELFFLCDNNSFYMLNQFIPSRRLINLGSTVIGLRKVIIQELLIHKIIKKNGIDLLHQIGQLPIRPIGCKTITNIADIDHFKSVQTNIFRRIYKEISYWLTLKQSAHVICPSYYTQKTLLKSYTLNKKKISVIYLGAADFPEPTFRIVEKINDKYWLSFGYLVNKNCETAIESLIFFNLKNNTSHKLVVIGESDYTENILKPLVKGKNYKNILFIGKVESSELHGLYLKAEGLLFLSLSEGFGLPLVEAMKTGCPVITSNLTSLPEIAGDGAIICDAFDYEVISVFMETISFNSNFRKNLIDRGLNRVKEMTWENAAKKVVDIYERILN